MRHLRLKTILSLGACILLSAAGAFLIIHDAIPQAIIAFACAVCAAAVTALTMRNLIIMVSTFVKGLEAKDSTMRFDTQTDSALLQEVTLGMNRIAENYRNNMRELETSKLYYDRILRFMTHEMRNLISPVISLAGDMKRNPSRYHDATLEETATIIEQQSGQIKRLLDSYHTLTHIPEPDIKRVDAIGFFRKVKSMADMEAGRRGLHTDVCRFNIAKGMTLDMDDSLMGQVMVNLIRNSLDAVADVGNPEVEITATVSDGNPCIYVSDNGCGIPDSVRENLFQPFMTTKPGGCGVGLTVSRQIMRRHGGELRLSGSPGHGARAVITFSRQGIPR